MILRFSLNPFIGVQLFQFYFLRFIFFKLQPTQKYILQHKKVKYYSQKFKHPINIPNT